MVDPIIPSCQTIVLNDLETGIHADRYHWRCADRTRTTIFIHRFSRRVGYWHNASRYIFRYLDFVERRRAYWICIWCFGSHSHMVELRSARTRPSDDQGFRLDQYCFISCNPIFHIDGFLIGTVWNCTRCLRRFEPFAKACSWRCCRCNRLSGSHPSFDVRYNWRRDRFARIGGATSIAALGLRQTPCHRYNMCGRFVGGNHTSINRHNYLWPDCRYIDYKAVHGIDCSRLHAGWVLCGLHHYQNSAKHNACTTSDIFRRG